MNKIPIVMATDSNFVFQTGVAISSMLQNKREETKYAFYILSDGKLLDTEKKMIIEIIESESYSEIDFIDIEMQEVDISSHVCHVSFATYYRFFL